MREQEQSLEVSKKQTEIFARQLLPEIRRFFADENTREEYKEWKKNQHNDQSKQKGA